jgi:hypothetical protein
MCTWTPHGIFPQYPEGTQAMKLIITKLDNGYTLTHEWVEIVPTEQGDAPRERKERFAFETKDALNRKLTELLA